MGPRGQERPEGTAWRWAPCGLPPAGGRRTGQEGASPAQGPGPLAPASPCLWIPCLTAGSRATCEPVRTSAHAAAFNKGTVTGTLPPLHTQVMLHTDGETTAGRRVVTAQDQTPSRPSQGPRPPAELCGPRSQAARAPLGSRPASPGLPPLTQGHSDDQASPCQTGSHGRAARALNPQGARPRHRATGDQGLPGERPAEQGGERERGSGSWSHTAADRIATLPLASRRLLGQPPRPFSAAASPSENRKSGCPPTTEDEFSRGEAPGAGAGTHMPWVTLAPCHSRSR